MECECILVLVGFLRKEVPPRADSGVTGERDLCISSEDINNDRFGFGGCGGGFVEDDGFSEVEFARDELFLGLGELDGGWEVNNGEGVAEEACVVEDVDMNKTQLLGHCRLEQTRYVVSCRLKQAALLYGTSDPGIRAT